MFIEDSIEEDQYEYYFQSLEELENEEQIKGRCTEGSEAIIAKDIDLRQAGSW